MGETRGEGGGVNDGRTIFPARMGWLKAGEACARAQEDQRSRRKQHR